MRKMNFLKTVLSVAFAMLALGAFAQNPPAPYGVYDANLTAPVDTDYVTVNKTVSYYALPDPVYHPNYVSAGTITAGFSWTWTSPSGPAAPTITPGVAGPPERRNYVTILYPSTGIYRINVVENAPAAMGGCADATPTIMNVRAIAAPTATLSINPAAPWQQILLNQSYQVCSNQAAQPVTLTINEFVPSNLASYSFQVTEQIELLDGADGPVAGVNNQAETVVQNFPLNGKLKTGNVGTLPGAAFAATATPGVYTFTFNSDALNILASGSPATGPNARTRYTYRVRKAGATVSATNEFCSNITNKSDYLLGAGNETYYAFTNAQVSFTVNPAPSTGAIYYIPNNYNY